MANGGPVQEGAKVAGGIVDALRSQPLMLTLIVAVGIFMYLVYSGIGAQRAQTHEILKILLERCGPQRTMNAPVIPL
jgi:hypothetical protein